MTAEPTHRVTRAVTWRLGLGVLLVVLSAFTIDRVTGPEVPGSFGTLTAEVTADDQHRADAALAVRDGFELLLDEASDSEKLPPLGWLRATRADGQPVLADALVDRGMLDAGWSAQLSDDVRIYSTECDGRVAVLVQSTVISDGTDLAAWLANQCPSPFPYERFVVFTQGELPPS